MEDLLRILNEVKPGVDFTKEDDLIESGILDSLSIIQLVTKISDEYKEEVLNREKRIRDAIEMFPVPNTKEDIVEFLSLAVSNANKKVSFMNTRKGRTILYVILAIVGIPIFFIGPPMAMLLFQNLGTSEGVLQEMRQKTWRAKFDQVLMKGRSLRGDSDFQQQLDYFESMVKQ